MDKHVDAGGEHSHAVRFHEDERPLRVSVDLFWSKQGIVACVTHAPAVESDVWQLQGWQQVPEWRKGFYARALQCQFCHGRPFVHQPRDERSEDRPQAE